MALVVRNEKSYFSRLNLTTRVLPASVEDVAVEVV